MYSKSVRYNKRVGLCTLKVCGFVHYKYGFMYTKRLGLCTLNLWGLCILNACFISKDVVIRNHRKHLLIFSSHHVTLVCIKSYL